VYDRVAFSRAIFVTFKSCSYVVICTNRKSIVNTATGRLVTSSQQVVFLITIKDRSRLHCGRMQCRIEGQVDGIKKQLI